MTVLRIGRLGVVIIVLAASMVLSAPSYACACGAAVAPGGAQATMNNEVALVHWDGTTENILMQVAMNASADNVALVVPTPTPATVAVGDKAAFMELDELTAPQIRHQRRWTLGIGVGDPAPREGAVAARPPEGGNQVRPGPLEATTLAGGDLAGLQKWLADNGYSIRPAVSDALNPYVREGWAFVAMRLTSEAPIVGGLNPVRLTFQSPRLVYPMRLSVAAADPQHVIIFTLSDHRQQRTDADAAVQNTKVEFAGNIAGAVQDPLLREWVGNHGSYLTKTRVDIFQTSGISSDFTFGNAPNDNAYRQVRIVYDNVEIPIVVILVAGLLVIMIVAAVIFLVVRRHGQRRAV
ncbi:hypothetical protein MSIMFB_05357 [Mycobacterium simulans]|uniref:DUF2330 domain-containing protein n=1 Tax=Mycobacterium simulans TaxID=627089 RepID=A0A7Z7ISC7_9MYCO|nr:DUF2330 domain-containing protein [Mycobacterium simulans]SOJ57879.1 hypothetical protein MSIMFB_05357 [Mycobacterium simulans]